MNQCPHCEQNIPSGLKVCPECGRKLPLANRALDAFGGTIPALFQRVHGPIQRIIPGRVGDILGGILGFTAVMIYMIAILAALVALFVALRALIFGRLGDVNWVEEIIDVFDGLSRMVNVQRAM